MFSPTQKNKAKTQPDAGIDACHSAVHKRKHPEQ